MKTPEALENIRSLDPYVPGLSIAEIRDRHGLSEVIKLASNENPLGASPLAREAVLKHAGEIFRYPAGGNPRLCHALARKHALPPELLAVGNGSDEIIDLLIRMVARPGKHNMICSRPCFSIYPIQGKINGISIRQKNLLPDFSFDYYGLLDLADENTRLVFITMPDNPSGFCPGAEEMELFAARLASKAPEALLIIDEAYIDFADEKAVSLLANKILPANTVFLRTMSKSWGLAGLRIGYAVMPESLADCFWRARLPFSINVLAEEAALAALEDDAFREATLRTVKEGRVFLHNGLAALGCKVLPSSANFIMFSLPKNSLAAVEAFEKLLGRGIIIRTLKSYGLPDYLRVSIGNARENRLFLTAMTDILKM